jgi:hypothetical protein
MELYGEDEADAGNKNNRKITIEFSSHDPISLTHHLFKFFFG